MDAITLLLLVASTSVLFSVCMVVAKQRGFMNWIDWSWLLACLAVILVIGFMAAWLAVADEWP